MEMHLIKYSRPLILSKEDSNTNQQHELLEMTVTFQSKFPNDPSLLSHLSMVLFLANVESRTAHICFRVSKLLSRVDPANYKSG